MKIMMPMPINQEDRRNSSSFRTNGALSVACCFLGHVKMVVNVQSRSSARFSDLWIVEIYEMEVEALPMRFLCANGRWMQSQRPPHTHKTSMNLCPRVVTTKSRKMDGICIGVWYDVKVVAEYPC